MTRSSSMSPVVILGMHRSGTTMIARFLEELGLFLGARKDQENEAVFFLKLNNWMLLQANASWDNPYNFEFVEESFLAHMIRVANNSMASLRRYEYLGWGKLMRYKRIVDLDIPWGWKDPRNTLTLPLWVRLMPGMRLIHIYRNPVDVAESLRKRALSGLIKFELSLGKKVREYFHRGKVRYSHSYRVLDLAEGFKLWKVYVRKAFDADKRFGVPIFHIKYEDFLCSPYEIMSEVLEFLSYKHDDNRLKGLLEKVNLERRNAFLSNKELRQFYDGIAHEKCMRELGYDALNTDD